MHTFRAAILGLLVASGQCYQSSAADSPETKPLTRAHAHNDYEHPRPLLDALGQGFCSVEADVFLVEGQLLVAHERAQVSRERTLQSLYLEPLRQRVRRNEGKVYFGGPEFSLLIDLKTNWRTTYPVLRAALEDYREMLSSFRDGKKTTRALTVIVSGSRDKEMFANEQEGLAAYDGQIGDLDSNCSPDLIPWISSSWGSLFQWRGAGKMPEKERARLDELVSRAHRQGRKLRFWGAPDNEGFWEELLSANIDLINTDNLARLRAFLEAHQRSSKTPEGGL